jgi:hypothetical protein
MENKIKLIENQIKRLRTALKHDPKSKTLINQLVEKIQELKDLQQENKKVKFAHTFNDSWDEIF